MSLFLCDLARFRVESFRGRKAKRTSPSHAVATKKLPVGDHSSELIPSFGGFATRKSLFGLDGVVGAPQDMMLIRSFVQRILTAFSHTHERTALSLFTDADDTDDDNLARSLDRFPRSISRASSEWRLYARVARYSSIRFICLNPNQ